MNENAITIYRLSFFFGGFILFTLLGYLFPWRKLRDYDLFRQINNFGLILVNSVLVKLLVGSSIFLIINHLEKFEFGLFNWVKLPFFIELILSILLLDLIIYIQHRVFHENNALWRLHRVHHSDISYDATTALRFHPIEILLSIVIKIISISILGISFIPFLVFEIILNFSAMFNHGNYGFGKLEKIMGFFLVTPKIHRTHHTDIPSEHNSNYGFFLSIWDRIFGTYTERSSYSDEEMVIGLNHFNSREDQRLDNLLIQPFKKVEK